MPSLYQPDPARMITNALSCCEPDERGLFLRQMLAHVGRGLVVLEGEAEASEAIYRLADAIVGGEGR